MKSRVSMSWELSTTNVDIGVVRDQPLLEIIGGSFNPAMAANRISLCRLLVGNLREFTHLLYSNNDNTLSKLLHKLLIPLMRKNVISRTLFDIANAVRAL